jgi:3-phosphoshikimate 1-carboxyvinyltransferase
MTIDILKQFEIEVDWNDDVINIKGGQEYKSPSEIYVEGDWSNMAFWLAAGAFNEDEMSCGNLNFYSIQGDRYILEIIKKFGINIIYDSNNSLILTHCPMNGIEIDASNVPDLVPVIALLASVSEGTTIISNIGRLRIKESDRIESIAQTLNKLGANVTATEDSLIIKGVKSLKGGEVDSCNDHRIVMMASIAAMVCEEPVIITNANAVNKSYRTFFEDYKKLGGIVKYVD